MKFTFFPAVGGGQFVMTDGIYVMRMSYVINWATPQQQRTTLVLSMEKVVGQYGWNQLSVLEGSHGWNIARFPDGVQQTAITGKI